MPCALRGLEPQQLISGCAQSIGKQRDHNEDCLFTFSATTGGEANSAPLGLYIVADGMGGHQYGEVASSTAVRTMANYMLKRFHTYLINPSEGMEEPLQEMMRAAITEAQTGCHSGSSRQRYYPDGCAGAWPADDNRPCR